MIVNTKAIILKGVPYGESDQILQVLTPELGKVGCFAKSGRHLQPLSLVELVLTPGKKDLYRLKEVQVIEPFLSLRDNFKSLKAALQVADLVDKFLPEEMPKPHLFDLLCAYLGKLGSAKNPENFYYSFLLKMMHVEGFLDPYSLPEGLQPLLITRKWNEMDGVVLSESDILFLQNGDFC